jgi:SRSO17 transposase
LHAGHEDIRQQSRFVAFVDGRVSVIGHADRAAPLRDYCTGLVMPSERKSVEPMAAVAAPANVRRQHQSLLHFVGEAPWSDERVLAKVREMVLPASCSIDRVIAVYEAGWSGFWLAALASEAWGSGAPSSGYRWRR